MDGAKLTNVSVRHLSLGQTPLRMEAIHKGLHHLEPGMGLGCFQQGLCVSDIHTQRFFTQHVFARLQSPDGPGDMQMVGQGIKDGVHFGIFQ